MLPCLTRKQARDHDADAVQRLGVPSLLLMENAGRGVYELLRTAFPARLSRIVVVGGTGQNGGDGWVVARQLQAAGHTPRCILVGQPDRVTGDAAVNFASLAPLGISVLPIAGAELAAAEQVLAEATLIVDGLFGTGLQRPVTGVQAQVVAAINRSPAPVLALDLPSGVDADSGAVLGVAVAAQHTATFVARKQGMLQHPGRGLCGQVTVCGIGVPPPPPDVRGILEDRDVAGWIAPRPAHAHKGTAGHLLVYGGDSGTTGAALLAGRAALRAGAGLVTLAPRARARAALDAKVVEMMTVELPEPDVDPCLELSARAGAAVVGPGFGRDPAGQRLLVELLRRLPLPAVVDADGLTALADAGPGWLVDAAGPRVLTPHPGEAARLLGVTSAEIQADRYGAALTLAERTGQVVVLKGAGTVIADSAGRVRVCEAGTPAMATAGMGDVLSGIVGALLCLLPSLEAAGAGVQLHARAGERSAHGDRGLLASELADALPQVVRALIYDS